MFYWHGFVAHFSILLIQCNISTRGNGITVDSSKVDCSMSHVLREVRPRPSEGVCAAGPNIKVATADLQHIEVIVVLAVAGVVVDQVPEIRGDVHLTGVGSLRPVSDTTWRAPMEAEAFAMDLDRLLTIPEFRADYCGAGASAKFWGEGYDLNSNYDAGVYDLPREWAAECAAANTTESHVNELMTNTAIDFRREASMAYHADSDYSEI